MKKIWHFLKRHIITDFHPLSYAAIAGLLVVTITLNYTFDFEDSYLDSLRGFTKFFNYLLFYTLPYMLSVWIWSYFSKNASVFATKEFWIKSLFGLAILSLDSSVPFLQPLIVKILPTQVQYWSFKVAVNLISFFTVCIPLLIFYSVYEKTNHDKYGLVPRRFDVRPYFTMLLIVLPLMIAASFTEGFLKQYPMYKASAAASYLGIPESLAAGIYEIAYGLDFITVEYLFRGFFVVAMMNVLQRGAVVSMAVLYCTLHFGKPMGEAISSIAGGYILGVVAFETRSIWGGVIVHMGLAWLMELIAFLHKI